MPAVTDSRLKGNYGAAVVMERLSGESLVRPVATDTDVGVDLYCETVVEGQPFLHFWIQVKAGEQCTVHAQSKASCSFDCDHLGYWARQPVPVFAALVPTDWPAPCEPDVYVVDITKQVLFDPPPGTQNSVTLSSDWYWPAGNRECVREFLREVVPDTTARLQCSRGVVAPSPTLTPQYVLKMPDVPVTRFKEDILNQLRRTAAYAVLFALHSGKETSAATEFRRLLVRIVEAFGDDPHWENFMARAQSSHADQDFENAVAFYQKAKDRIGNDPNVCDQPAWQHLVGSIEQLKVRAQGHQPLARAD